MRVAFHPGSDELWTDYYLQQSGAGFIGMPYQRGGGLGSFFRGIFRALLPIVKTAGKTIGKQALATGANIASDIVAGKSIKGAFNEHGRHGAASLLQEAASKLTQRGTGLKRRRRKKKAPKKKATKKKATKRKATKKKAIKKKKNVQFSDQLGLYFK